MEEELYKQRSEVIEKSINLEWIIAAIISHHYLGHNSTKFLFEVLYDEYFSFALKRRILVKVVKDFDTKILQKLNRMNTIRNYFAHCNQLIFKVGETEGKILDPRNPERAINFNDLYKEFIECEAEVVTYVAKIYTDIGGDFLKEKK